MKLGQRKRRVPDAEDAAHWAESAALSPCAIVAPSHGFFIPLCAETCELRRGEGSLFLFPTN